MVATLPSIRALTSARALGSTQILASVRTLGSAISSSRVSTSAKVPLSISCRLLHLTPPSALPPSLLTTGSHLDQLSQQLDATFSQTSSNSFLLRQLLPPPPCSGSPTGQTTLHPHLLWAFRTSFSDLTASQKTCLPALSACPGTPCLPPAFSPGSHCPIPALLSPALPSLYCLPSPPATQRLSLGTLFAHSLQHLSLSPPLPLLPPLSRPLLQTLRKPPCLPTLHR